MCVCVCVSFPVHLFLASRQPYRLLITLSSRGDRHTLTHTYTHTEGEREREQNKRGRDPSMADTEDVTESLLREHSKDFSLDIAFFVPLRSLGEMSRVSRAIPLNLCVFVWACLCLCQCPCSVHVLVFPCPWPSMHVWYICVCL